MFIICLFMTYFQTISEHSYCGVVLIRYSSEIVVKLCRCSRLHKFAKKYPINECKFTFTYEHIDTYFNNAVILLI